MTVETILAARHVDKDLGGRRILNDISASVGNSRAVAVRTFLLTQPRVFALYAAGLFLCLLVCGVFLLALAFAQPHMSVADILVKAMAPAVCISAFAGSSGSVIARQSRQLWLTGGLDRAGLFRLCESLAWRSFGATATAVFLLPVIAGLIDPATGIFVALMLLLQLSAGVCLLYWGLMHVRGWLPADVLITIVLGGAWITEIVAALSAQRQLMLLPTLMAGAAIVALALRTIAWYRWRRIDWLLFRPRRPLAAWR